MDGPEKRNPAGGPGSEGGLQDRLGRRWEHDNPLSRAAVKTLCRELHLILTAAHRVASYQQLAWSDYTRVHEAHQHVMRVLAVMYGREVLT
jgi:hypothetical protein